MRLRFTTFKDRGDLLEGARENFLNTLEELKTYVANGEFAFFVNVKNVHGETNAPFRTYREAHEQAEKLATQGYNPREIYISCVSQQYATADDIDV